MSHDRYRPQDPQRTGGSWPLLGLFVALWVLIALLAAAALGWQLPDWQVPCPKQDQEQTP